MATQPDHQDLTLGQRVQRTGNTCPCPRCIERKVTRRHHADYSKPRLAPLARLVPHRDVLHELWPT